LDFAPFTTVVQAQKRIAALVAGTKIPSNSDAWGTPHGTVAIFFGCPIGMIFLTVGATLTTATEQSVRMVIWDEKGSTAAFSRN
jgi:hypothetical protein